MRDNIHAFTAPPRPYTWRTCCGDVIALACGLLFGLVVFVCVLAVAAFLWMAWRW